MPVIKSAIKKLRQAKVKTERNRKVKRNLKELTDKFKKSPTPKLFASLSSALDKAAKTHVLHSNKASRLKSRLSARLAKKK